MKTILLISALMFSASFASASGSACNHMKNTRLSDNSKVQSKSGDTRTRATTVKGNAEAG